MPCGEGLNTDTQPAAAAMRKRLRDMIFEMGNSGGSHNETVEVDMPAEATQGETQREQAWAQLGLDFSIPTKSLGTEAIAVIAAGAQGQRAAVSVQHAVIRLRGRHVNSGAALGYGNRR